MHEGGLYPPVTESIIAIPDALRRIHDLCIALLYARLNAKYGGESRGHACVARALLNQWLEASTRLW